MTTSKQTPPLLGVIDSHCHLQSLPPGDLETILDRARDRGVRGFLVPGIRFEDADRLLELCARHADVWCALGVHPHEAKQWTRGSQERLGDLLSQPGVVAVGECGLDFHYDLAPRDRQLVAVVEQWELARALDLPVIVHNRESDEVIAAEVVARPALAGVRGVFHSFSGSDDLLAAVLTAGFHVGYSGMVTFKAADNVRGALAQTPLEKVLVETDSPYLAPVPHRGKPNEPGFVVEVARRVAEEKGVTAEDLAARTSQTFFELFQRARA